MAGSIRRAASRALCGEPQQRDRGHRVGEPSGHRGLDGLLGRPDADADVLALARQAAMRDQPVGARRQRATRRHNSATQFVAAAGRQQEIADRARAGRPPARFPPASRGARSSPRVLARVGKPGGQLDHHRVDARGQRRQAELLDQHDLVGDRVVGQRGGGPAAAPQLPGPFARTARRRSGGGGSG